MSVVLHKKKDFWNILILLLYGTQNNFRHTISFFCKIVSFDFFIDVLVLAVQQTSGGNNSCQSLIPKVMVGRRVGKLKTPPVILINTWKEEKWWHLNSDIVTIRPRGRPIIYKHNALALSATLYSRYCC